MKFKTLSTFALFDGEQMHVFNTGDLGELPDNLAQPYVDAGMAEPVKAKKGKPDPVDPPAGDPAPDAPPATDDGAAPIV